MTAAQAATVLGRTGELRTKDGLRVAVRVVDARTVFGRDDYLVEPVAGCGQAWVDASRVVTS